MMPFQQLPEILHSPIITDSTCMLYTDVQSDVIIKLLLRNSIQLLLDNDHALLNYWHVLYHQPVLALNSFLYCCLSAWESSLWTKGFPTLSKIPITHTGMESTLKMYVMAAIVLTRGKEKLTPLGESFVHLWAPFLLLVWHRNCDIRHWPHW